MLNQFLWYFCMLLKKITLTIVDYQVNYIFDAEI